MRKILVVGGTGFVGKRVCKMLLQENQKIRLVSRNTSSDFDDINSATYPALDKIISDLRKNKQKQIYAYTFWINGWLGKHQNQHKNAILSTFDIENFLMDERIKLKNFKKLAIS